jgi:thiamine biosynthesis lipoprotein
MVLLSGCGSSEVPVYTTQFNAFGSAVDLSIVGMQRERAATAATALERDLQFFDHMLFGADSGRMLRVNELLASGEPFAAPPSLIPLLQRAQALSAQSQGLFNPAMGRLTRLWGLQSPSPLAHAPPDAKAIQRLLEAEPSMDDLYLDGIELQSDNPAVELDFNSVASAYAMDLAVEALRTQGVRSAMINAGGDVRAIGNRSGRPWRIPVPRASGTGVIGILDVSGDASLFTASPQRRNFIDQGEVYHSVLDPRSGRPARGAASATVLHQGDALTAAAAANALMVAGVADWPRIAAGMHIRYALVIDADGNLHMTPGMDQILELLDSNPERIVTPLPEDGSGPSEPAPDR